MIKPEVQVQIDNHYSSYVACLSLAKTQFEKEDPNIEKIDCYLKQASYHLHRAASMKKYR